MKISQNTPLKRISSRISDYEYSLQLENEIAEMNERIAKFKQLMDTQIHTISSANVVDCYVQYCSYLDGRKTLEECEKNPLTYLTQE